MSRIITSESDTDNELSSQPSDLSTSQLLGQEPPEPLVVAGSDRSITMERKLELYSRRLSQIGLADKDDSSVSSASEQVVKTPTEQTVPRPIVAEKVRIKFIPIGSIPAIKPSVCKISAAQSFAAVITFLRGRLAVSHVFCYINNSFAPSPQQNVGDLWRQFKVGEDLIVSYCGTVAFG